MPSRSGACGRPSLVVVLVCLCGVAAGCDPPRFSGRLEEVVVVGPAQVALGLFRTASDVNRPQIFVRALGGRCEAQTDFRAAGATSPIARFSSDDVPIDVVLDPQLPANAWVLVAWIDDDADGELDFDPDPSRPSETCVAASRGDGARQFLTRIESFDDDEALPFRGTIEDEQGVVSFLVDDEASGWQFVFP